jgi:hypothetical protein
MFELAELRLERAVPLRTGNYRHKADANEPIYGFICCPKTV